MPALKITFENLPIIKTKAMEKKVADHGWATRKIFRNGNFESVWTAKDICIAMRFMISSKEVMRGISHNLGVIKNDRRC